MCDPVKEEIERGPCKMHYPLCLQPLLPWVARLTNACRVLNILLTGRRCLWSLAAGPDCCRAGAASSPQHRAGGAWALGGLEEDPYRGKLCLIASVYFFNTENCCESSTVSPNRPPWEMGASRIFSERLSQRWHSWTIARPRACAITFITRRA